MLLVVASHNTKTATLVSRYPLGGIFPQPAKDAPTKLRSPENWPNALELSELALEPSVDWAAGLRETWQPGESGAKSQLNRFQKEDIQEYPVGRDRPDIVGTSRLSPHLHFGEISPGQVWRAVLGMMNDGTVGSHAACEAYLRQIGWREFAHQLLYNHPESPEQALRPEFTAFPWKTDPRTLRAWTQGKTGYPLVDAGMRELWHTGWMHNRVRMITASFLIKDLLIDWKEGARWFWDTLVDADLASNTLGWQWVAGSGADAAPFFRIFNPTTQGTKFDPDGTYVRRWVPELASLGNEWIHRPWEAPETALSAAGIALGEQYPRPMVDHDMARKAALRALSAVKK